MEEVILKVHAAQFSGLHQSPSDHLRKHLSSACQGIANLHTGSGEPSDILPLFPHL